MAIVLIKALINLHFVVLKRINDDIFMEGIKRLFATKKQWV